MTNRLMILAIALAASACASSPRRPTTTVRYACGETTVLRNGESVSVDIAGRPGPFTALRWSDDEGDHFISSTQGEATEYVVPHDERKDAVEKRYDTTAGYSTSDWRVLEQRVCRAEGGYTDVLTRFMNGDSLDKVAADLSLEDRKSARMLVRKALAQLQRKYLKDR